LQFDSTRQTTRSCKSKTKQNKRKQNKAKLITKQSKAKSTKSGNTSRASWQARNFCHGLQFDSTRQTTRSCKSKTKQNKRKQNKAKLTTKQNKAKQNQQRVEIPVEQAGKLATVATVCSLTARQTTRSCKSKTKQRKTK
jgi:hypothetical protein